MAGSADRVEYLNQHLWTYGDRSFLPHGSARDGESAMQPIWLTAEEENPNGAEVLFLTDGAEHAQPGGFRLVCELFDGRDPEAVEAARARWRGYRAAGHEVTYWQQTDRGGWEKKG
jgi:DNA polymerase-3 subunit chi